MDKFINNKCVYELIKGFMYVTIYAEKSKYVLQSLYIIYLRIRTSLIFTDSL